MAQDERGLYEQFMTEPLATFVRERAAKLTAQTVTVRPAEAPDRIALHLNRVVQRALEEVPEDERVRIGMQLARTIIETTAATTKTDQTADLPHESGEMLRALLRFRPDGTPQPLTVPLIPLLDTTLLTNSPGEPRVGNQLLTEIESADQIDVLMAFIRRSGIYPFRDALRRFCEEGRKLRVLTTTYTGSTEAEALDLLVELGAEVRVSYDTSTTRLHAKAWSFRRESGFSTAYIGSSNLTHSAQVTGLEWNVRISGARNPDVIEKMAAVFEAYWSNGDFVAYEATEFAANEKRARESGPTIILSPLELRPEPFQERLLEQISVSREQGHHNNLLVAATGTGKTVMAALDYAGLRSQLKRARLLFIAHREEILSQSLATFRQCLREADFGELWVGKHKPEVFDHVFASVQSLNASDILNQSPDHFDVVVVDEIHHAASSSYRRILDHLRPKELLGLTATPERSDGLPILSWFGNRIAAELRLWDAIDQHRLSPFAYYGVHDGLDLRDIPWRRGRGYDPEKLSELLTANEVWARHVLSQLAAHVTNVQAIRALGFCVSIQHAQYMARVFTEAGVAAKAVWADTPELERRGALSQLARGELKIVFSVDLFNEGVDVPAVDTLLFLRPTDSPTLFLQQLGRGLRKSTSKSTCTVLDFVGRHRKEFRFDVRYRALLGGTRKEVSQQIEGGFPFLPAGCHMELDRVATEIVLENIRLATPSRWAAKVEELRALAAAGELTTLGHYLKSAVLDLEDVYWGGKSWSNLREDAGLPVAASGPHERALRRACGRLLHIDDAERLAAFQRFLTEETTESISQLAERERRLLRMLVAPVLDSVIAKGASLDEGFKVLRDHPQVVSELVELFSTLSDRIDHLHQPVSAEVPLQVHARYTRDEILAAFGIGDGAKVAPWQTGVYWAREARTDLLAFTLDKTSGEFSPTTRYRDYAISRELIHWESQSSTRARGETGRRYQNHASRGSKVMLFARLRTSDRAFWFLGPATYVEHRSEAPMQITWRLQHALPGDLFATFAAAVA